MVKKNPKWYDLNSFDMPHCLLERHSGSVPSQSSKSFAVKTVLPDLLRGYSFRYFKVHVSMHSGYISELMPSFQLPLSNCLKKIKWICLPQL